MSKNNFYGTGGTTIKTISLGNNGTPKQKKYKLCKDSYSGHGGYADGKYLFQFRREEDDDFDIRKEQAYYLNLMGPIIDSTIDSVFSQEITREYNNPLFEPFVEDADARGASLEDFVKSGIVASNVMGQAFIIMDSFPAEEIPRTLSEQINSRKVPFVELKTPLDVRKYQVDRFNKIDWITFFHGTDEKDREILRRYDSEYITEFVIENDEEVQRSRTEHGAGRVPVIVMQYGEILPEPDTFSMSQASRTLYNQLSELRELGRDSSFSLLVIPGNDPKVTIEIGPKNALFVPQNVSNMPSYISPDQNVPKSLLEEIKFTVESILSMGELRGATVQTKNMSVKSGVALAFEFHGNVDALNENADLAEKTEENIAALFGDYTRPFEYVVTYGRDFSPFSKTEAKTQFEFLSGALDMHLSPEIDQEIKVQILELVKYNTSIENERYIELKDTIQIAIDKVPEPAAEPELERDTELIV